MAEARKSAPIVDVARPGKTAPSPNSRAVITNHGPMMPDPMVVTEKTPDDQKPAAKTPSKGSSKARIQPLSAPLLDAAAKKAVAPKPKEPAEQVVDEAEPEAETPVEQQNDSDAVTVTVKKPVAAEAPAPAEELAKDEPVKDSDPTAETATEVAELSPQAVDDAAAVEQAQHDSAIQKLIDSKQYFLPINSLEKRRTKQFVIVGIILSVVLAVAWLDVALDASLIQLPGIKPVTHFFSN